VKEFFTLLLSRNVSLKGVILSLNIRMRWPGMTWNDIKRIISFCLKPVVEKNNHHINCIHLVRCVGGVPRLIVASKECIVT
jgi:hypothetical protein